MLSLRDASQSYKVRKKSAASAGSISCAPFATSPSTSGAATALPSSGESGCGKSTLMRLLCRLELPSSGQILLQRGRYRKSERQATAGIPGQTADGPAGSVRTRCHLAPSVGKILEDPLRTHGWRDKAKICARVLKVMGEVGLPVDLYEELPLGLSAGQRQRINVARALVLEPEILIMDETLVVPRPSRAVQAA